MTPEAVELWSSRMTHCAAWATVIAAVLGFFAFYLTKKDAANKVAELSRFTAHAKERTATLENETAKAKLELAKFKEQVTWRKITAAQATALSEKFNSQAVKVSISYILGDMDSGHYAMLLSNLFQHPKREVRIGTQHFDATIPHGIHIYGDDARSVQFIKEAFDAAEIPYHSDLKHVPSMTSGDINNADVKILIGPQSHLPTIE